MYRSENGNVEIGPDESQPRLTKIAKRTPRGHVNFVLLREDELQFAIAALVQIEAEKFQDGVQQGGR